jgi:hypothetical protein
MQNLPASIGNSLLPETKISLRLQVLIFNIVKVLAQLVLDQRNACMGRKNIDSVQSRQRFRKAKLGTKGPEDVPSNALTNSATN